MFRDLSVNLAVRRDADRVSWKNTGHNTVEVTLNLVHLRPYPEWVSNDDDIVLFVPSQEVRPSIEARWTVTAQGYGRAYEGDALTLVVQGMTYADGGRMNTE